MQVGLLGASGFVGAAIGRRLRSRGHDLRTVSRTPPEDLAGWLAQDLAGSDGEIAEADGVLAASDGVLAASDDVLAAHLEGCEVLVDAATLTSYAAAPFDDMAAVKRVNLGIPLRVGRLLPASIRRIVYLSTIDVYAIRAPLPLTEESPTGPATNYARTKRLAEHAYQQVAAERGISLVVLRLSQIYGPGDPSPKVVPSFIRSVLASGCLPRLSGAGTESRDFLHVDDAAACAELALVGPDGFYNVATGLARPVSDVPRILSRLTGLPEGGCDGRPNGKASLAFDITKARRDLGFDPAITLEQGLMGTLEWMRSRSSS